MKTLNIVLKSVVIVVMFFVATSANAQTETQIKYTPEEQAWIQYIDYQISLLGGQLKGKANCADLDTIIIKNGDLDEVVVIRHNRTKISSYFGVSSIHGEANDLGTQNVASTTYGVSFEFVNHIPRKAVDAKGKRKDAIVGLYLGIDAEVNSSVTIENLKTSAFGLFANGGAVFNPCGKLQATIAGSFGYLNSTSQRFIETEVGRNPIDYKGNATYLGIMAKLSYRIACRKTSKLYNINGKMVRGTAKNPIELFVKGRYGTTEIGKPRVNNEELTWNGRRSTIAGGVSLTF